MPSPTEIVEELRLMNTEFKRLGGWSNDASYISNLAEKVLWLADEVMKLEVAIATLKDSRSQDMVTLLNSLMQPRSRGT